MPLKRRGDVWWVRFKHLGEPVELSTEVRGARTGSNRARAAREAERLRVEHRAKNPAPAAGERLSRLAALDIARALNAKADPRHERTLTGIWKPVLTYFGPNRDPSTITDDEMRAYVGQRKARGQTIVRELQAFRRGMKLARIRGRVEVWPRVRSDAPKPEQRGKLHPPAIVVQVLAKVPEQCRRKVLFALATGLRGAELERFSLAWVEPAPVGHPTPWLVRIPPAAAKTRRERIVGLEAWALEEAKGAAAKRLEDGRGQKNRKHPTPWPPAFGAANATRAMREACRELKITPTVTLRDCRHTFATLALARTADPWAVLESMGHSDLRMLSRYQSTTITRAAAVGAAVGRALEAFRGGTAEGGQSDRKRTKSNENGGVDGT